jgi:hypothetical protein
MKAIHDFHKSNSIFVVNIPPYTVLVLSNEKIITLLVGVRIQGWQRFCPIEFS